MFFYFPIKQPDGTVAGSVRAEHGRATLLLRRPIEAECTLFADGRQIPILQGAPVPADRPEALLGWKDGRTVLFGVAPGVRADSAEYAAKLSQNRTKSERIPTVSVGSPEASLPKTSVEAKAVPEFGVNLSHIAEKTSSGSGFAQTTEEAEDPTVLRAIEVFRTLETLHPSKALQPPADSDAIPKTVHNVDNSVDNLAAERDSLVRKRDEFVRTDGTDALLGIRHDDANLPKLDLFPRIFPGATWRFVAQDGFLPHFEGIWQHGGERLKILAVRGTYAAQPPKGLSGFTRYLKTDGAGYWVRILPMPHSESVF